MLERLAIAHRLLKPRYLAHRKIPVVLRGDYLPLGFGIGPVCWTMVERSRDFDVRQAFSELISTGPGVNALGYDESFSGS